MMRRNDGFQAKWLRTILRIAPSFISRVSNKEVFGRAGHKPASEIVLKQPGHKPASEIVLNNSSIC